jgi:hypothetical protein
LIGSASDAEPIENPNAAKDLAEKSASDADFGEKPNADKSLTVWERPLRGIPTADARPSPALQPPPLPWEDIAIPPGEA